MKDIRQNELCLAKGDKPYTEDIALPKRKRKKLQNRDMLQKEVKIGGTVETQSRATRATDG